MLEEGQKGLAGRGKGAEVWAELARLMQRMLLSLVKGAPSWKAEPAFSVIQFTNN